MKMEREYPVELATPDGEEKMKATLAQIEELLTSPFATGSGVIIVRIETDAFRPVRGSRKPKKTGTRKQEIVEPKDPGNE